MMDKKNIEDMSTFEQARWYALVEAVNIIGDECDERGKNFNKMKISPLDLEKYIENTCDIFARKIIEENEKRNIKKTLKNNDIIPSLLNLRKILMEAEI